MSASTHKNGSISHVSIMTIDSIDIYLVPTVCIKLVKDFFKPSIYTVGGTYMRNPPANVEDRGARWTTVHGFTKNWAELSN